ncbi:hypothetical protein D0869_01642 [Hortaea werneckii]|uniref:Uncharacterized protein n=1 Tax=Hortaea werneckii TaxID=91943 RepID=A0A3M6XCY2_HORWE|nr:hypothetical protein D0869_01642 [Hortaea werneckii]RMY18017.1 hypothetical protein D0867_05618 [Hortaea werneckii]
MTRAIFKEGQTFWCRPAAVPTLPHPLKALTSRVQHSTWLLSMPTVLADLTKEAPKPYAEKAQKSGKKLIMQEWGTCYYDTRNNN